MSLERSGVSGHQSLEAVGFVIRVEISEDALELDVAGCSGTLESVNVVDTKSTKWIVGAGP